MERHELEAIGFQGCGIMGNEPAEDHEVICKVMNKYAMHTPKSDISLTPSLSNYGYWESWITAAISKIVEPGMRVIDVGANVGYFTLLLADWVGAKGFVYAWECNPYINSLLTKNVVRNGFSDNVKVINYAASDKTGTGTLYVPAEYWGSASITADFEGQYETRKFPIETRRIEDETDGTVDFIKIDIEGAEIEAFAGLGRLLENPKIQIGMEFHWGRYADRAEEFLKSLEQDYGFVMRYINFEGWAEPISIDALMRQTDWLELYLARR